MNDEGGLEVLARADELVKARHSVERLSRCWGGPGNSSFDEFKSSVHKMLKADTLSRLHSFICSTPFEGNIKHCIALEYVSLVSSLLYRELSFRAVMLLHHLAITFLRNTLLTPASLWSSGGAVLPMLISIRKGHANEADSIRYCALQEYMLSHDREEAEVCLQRLGCRSAYHELVKQALRMALEQKFQTAAILDLLSNLAAAGFLSEEQLLKVRNLTLPDPIPFYIEHIWLISLEHWK